MADQIRDHEQRRRAEEGFNDRATKPPGSETEMTEERLEYHILPPGDPVAALNILREVAGLGPWREEGEEVGGDEC
jgi:hypothetical protein